MFERLYATRIHLQVGVLCAIAPVVVGLLGMSLVPLVVNQSLIGIEREVVAVSIAAVRVAFAGVVVCGLITAIGAALLLRFSMRNSIDGIRRATEAISSGDFTHRIKSSRKDELGSLAHAIDTAAGRLEKLEYARREMLACVSHELRTPLTIAKGAVRSLSKSPKDDRYSHLCLMLDEEINTLSALIDDLIDSASLRAGGVKLNLEVIDLNELARDAISRFYCISREKNISINLSVKSNKNKRPFSYLDYNRAHQIIGNVLANAVRHAEQNSIINVIIKEGQAQDNVMHQIIISNVGDLIPNNAKELIFKPFSQFGESCGRAGLGLSIVKDLIEAHGGDIRLDQSEVLRTVSFTLMLPKYISRDTYSTHKKAGSLDSKVIDEALLL